MLEELGQHTLQVQDRLTPVNVNVSHCRVATIHGSWSRKSLMHERHQLQPHKRHALTEYHSDSDQQMNGELWSKPTDA